LQTKAGGISNEDKVTSSSPTRMRRYLDGCGESGALSRLKARGRLQLKHPNVRDW